MTSSHPITEDDLHSFVDHLLRLAISKLMARPINVS
jgi:hypothetical protein